MPSRATQTCSCCGKHKPLGQFGKMARNPDGLQNLCKPCLQLQAEAWKKKNPDVVEWHRAKASVIR